MSGPPAAGAQGQPDFDAQLQMAMMLSMQPAGAASAPMTPAAAVQRTLSAADVAAALSQMQTPGFAPSPMLVDGGGGSMVRPRAARPLDVDARSAAAIIFALPVGETRDADELERAGEPTGSQPPSLIVGMPRWLIIAGRVPCSVAHAPQQGPGGFELPRRLPRTVRDH
jgi:hypothetical protein